MIRRWQLFFFSLLSAACCYAADSTTIYTTTPPTPPPTPVKPASQVTVGVTHIVQRISWRHSISCPKAPDQETTNGTWKGKSPVKDGTLVAPDVFYPFDSSYSEGYAVYTCSETYWSTDPYYQQLVSNITVPCQNDFYTPSVCTIKGKMDNAMSGVLPIHFVVDKPTQVHVGMQTLSTGTVTITATAFGTPSITFAPQAFPPDVNGRTFTSGTDFSAVYPVGTHLILGISWYYPNVQLEETFWPSNQSNPPRLQGITLNFACPGPVGAGLHMGINNDMLGKTCHLRCDDTGWSFAERISHNTYTAPLIFYCEGDTKFRQ